MKKKILNALSLMSVIFIASCGETNNSSSSDIAESSEESSSIISSSEETKEGGLYADFSSTTLTLGQTFREAAAPVFYLNGKEITQDNLTTISLKMGNESFSMDAPLTKTGTYTFFIRKSGNSFSKDFIITEGNTTTATDGNGYTKVSDEDAKKYALQNVPYAGSLTYGKMPSTGTINIIVIPVVFKDAKEEYQFTSGELNTIEKGYFGKASETGWESLSSYYEKSSYGKLHIQGFVSEVYTSEYTSSKLQDKFFNTGMTPEATNDVMNAAVEQVFKDNPSLDRKDYDYDGDGFLDGVEIIYKSDKKYGSGEEGSNVWWNFTTYDDTNKPNVDSPAPRRYFWSNITQLQTGYYKTNIDTHTLVHETGHLLGLNDYYDNADLPTFPTGGADMMELNIGDHDAYSKYLLGWVNPMAVDGSLNDFEITLNDFESSGDCVLIRNTTTDKWNGTPYDEYLMLSYYTPTGLNEQDSKGYGEWKNYGTGGTYSYRGLQVFHVDERLYTNVGSTMNSEDKLTKAVRSYTDDVLSIGTEKDSNNVITKDYAYQATSNYQANSYEVKDSKLLSNSSFKEITLIPASGDGSLYKATTRDYACKLGSSDALMGLSEFGAKYNGYSKNKMKSCFPNKTTFNDGSNFEYNFFVSKQTDSTITVRFVKAS